MAAPMSHMENKHDVDVEFTLKSGASLVKTKPIFSYDSKYLLVCCGSLVKVYSTLSGECVRELRGHRSYVTGLVIHPKNKLRVVSCSLDKTIRVWDYLDGVLFQTITCPSKIHGIYTAPDSNMVFLIENSEHGNSLIRRPLSKKCETSPLVCLKKVPIDPRCTAISQQGHFSVTLAKKGMVWAENISKGKSVTHTSDSRQKFTCVVCHPNGKCIATGCQDGKIVMWYKFESAADVVRTTIHWHSLSVRDLCYTPEGSYLLSGGHECVLVKMHQETKYKDFLPRLGAHINHLVCSRDNIKYAICLEDNCIQVISSSLSLEQVYQGLTRSYLKNRGHKNPIPTGLHLEPRLQALVTNGKPGHLQFYNVHEDRQLYNLDIIGQNFISPDNLEHPLAVTTVTSAAFDSVGNWLVTAEHWSDGENTPDIRLKFWQYLEESQSYTLVTVVESPHTERIDWVKMRPVVTSAGSDTTPMAVSSSTDGKFRTWTLVDDTDIYRKNVKWNCQSVGYYRDLPAGDVAFTEDGSLLAVVFGSVVTLWEPDNNHLKGTLVKQNNNCPVVRLEFGSGSCCQYLVTHTEEEMLVWDLISLTVYWSVSTSVACLTSDPRSGIMAAFTFDRDLFVFRPSDPSPIASYTKVSNSKVLSAVFIPHSHKSHYEGTPLSWQSKSELFFMNQNQELLAVGFKMSTERPTQQSDVVQFTQNLPQSALSLLMQGHTHKSGLRVEQDLLKEQPQGKYLSEIFQSASHVQPSVQMLCQPFLHSLLRPSGSRKKHRSVDDEEDEGTEEEEDDTRIHDSQTGSLDSGVSDMEVDSVYLNQSGEGSQSESAESSQTATKHGRSKVEPLSTKSLGELSHDDLTLIKKNLSWYNQSVAFT